MFSIKRFLFFSAVFSAALFLTGCGPQLPDRIMPYSCEYTLFVNGIEAGSAEKSLEITDSLFIENERLEMVSADRKYVTTYQIRETGDFKPVSLKTENFTETGGVKQVLVTAADFDGSTAAVKVDEKLKKVRLPGNFSIGGNFFMQKLIDQGFKEGCHVEGTMYDPVLSLEETIRFSVKVMGSKTVMINGWPEKLIHIKEIIEDFKDIDIYLGDGGILRKMTVLMLNNRIELVIKK